MNVKILVPSEKSSSRKVNKYVKLFLTRNSLQRKLDEVATEMEVLMAKMTGGQLAEAQRILTTH